MNATTLTKSEDAFKDPKTFGIWKGLKIINALPLDEETTRVWFSNRDLGEDVPTKEISWNPAVL
jgi:hypothetical protein